MTSHTMEKRFDEALQRFDRLTKYFVRHGGIAGENIDGKGVFLDHDAVKSFLRSELERAYERGRKEERERWLEAIDSQRMDDEEEKVAREIGLKTNSILDAVINVHDNEVAFMHASLTERKEQP